MKLKSGVYRILNMVNGKSYVGSSTDVKYRLWRHRHELREQRHENMYLQNAWNKHGENSFKLEILFYCDREHLLKREQEMIEYYQSTWRDNGYNICSIAGNCLGIKRSLKTREKMRGNTNAKGRIGTFHSEEAKAKMSKAKLGKESNMKGKHHSEISKSKMSAAKVGKPGPRKGVSVSEETKKKMSDSHRGHNKGMTYKRHQRELNMYSLN
jgi:group I intron endonuclease